MSSWELDDSDVWELQVPYGLVPAIEYLRGLFEEAHLIFFVTTQSLCFAQLHDLALDQPEHKEHIDAFNQLRAFLEPFGRQRFSARIAEGTLSAIFKSYFDFYLDGMSVQPFNSFGRLWR